MKLEGWKITAWALDELEGPEADEVAAAVAADPALMDEVEAVLGSARYAERGLAELPAASVAPPAPVEHTRTGPVGAVVARAPRRRATWRWAAAAGVALAAAVALIAALAAPDEPTRPKVSPFAVEPTTGGDRSVAGTRPEVPKEEPPAWHEDMPSEAGTSPPPSEGPQNLAEAAPAPAEGPETQAGAPPTPPVEDTPTPTLTIIVDPPDATLMVSKGRIEALGEGLYEVHGLAVGDVVKARVERADGTGRSIDVKVDGARRVARVSLREEKEPPSDPPPARDEGPAQVALNARPWAQVTIDGRLVGTTPKTVTLEPGRHVFVFARGAARVKKVVRVRAGQRLTLTHDFYNE